MSDSTEPQVPSSPEVIVEEVIQHNRRTVPVEQARENVRAKLARYPDAGGLMIETCYLRALLEPPEDFTIDVETFDQVLTRVRFHTHGVPFYRDWSIVTAVLHELGIRVPKSREYGYWHPALDVEEDPSY